MQGFRVRLLDWLRYRLQFRARHPPSSGTCRYSGPSRRTPAVVWYEDSMLLDGAQVSPVPWTRDNLRAYRPLHQVT